jgi:hypothetical protein
MSKLQWSLCIMHGIILCSKLYSRKIEKNTDFQATTFPYWEPESEIKSRLPINQRQDFNRGNRQYTIKALLVLCVLQRSPFESLWHLPKSVINFFHPGHRLHVFSCCFSHVTVQRATSSSQVNPWPAKCSIKAGNRRKSLGANLYCKGEGPTLSNWNFVVSS